MSVDGAGAFGSRLPGITVIIPVPGAPVPWVAVDSSGFLISKLDGLVESVDPEGPGWFSSFQL